MDQFDALAICANPLRERAAYARESIVSQLGREDDLGDATYHRTIERKRLLRRDRFNLRFYFSCPNAKAERGTEAAEPTDKRATGEHPANVRGVGRATRRFAPRNGGEIPHKDSRGGAEKRMRRGDTTVFSAASAPPRDALGSVCYCSMRTSCLLSPVSCLLSLTQVRELGRRLARRARRCDAHVPARNRIHRERARRPGIRPAGARSSNVDVRKRSAWPHRAVQSETADQCRKLLLHFLDRAIDHVRIAEVDGTVA